MGLQEDIIEKEKNQREGGSERKMVETTSSMEEVIQRTVFVFVMCTLTFTIPSSNCLALAFLDIPEYIFCFFKFFKAIRHGVSSRCLVDNLEEQF